MSNEYYVYGYYRFDKNSFFYIGKGKGDRYKCTQNRSKHFINIINKIPYTVFILYNSLTEDEAFQYEKEAIENLVECGYSIDIKGYDKKEKHLTNQCWGGKGGLGGVPKNDYVKQCVTESNKKRRGKNSAKSKSVVLLNTKEYFECLTDGSKKYNISEPCISNCCNNKSTYAGEYNGERLVWVFEEDFKNISEEDIENKIFIAQKSASKKGEYNSFYGKTHTEETKDSIRKALGVKVKCIELNMEFDSIHQARRYMIETYGIVFVHKSLKQTLDHKRKQNWYKEIEINGVLTKLHWEYC